MGDVSKFQGNMWRFCVVGDPLVERYVIRDTDSPILQRELDAVAQWLESGRVSSSVTSCVANWECDRFTALASYAVQNSRYLQNC